MERKRINETYEVIDIEDLFEDKTLDEVHLFIQSLSNKYERDIMQHDKLVKFRYEPEYEGPGTFMLDTYRWETEEEFTKREEKSRKAKEARAKKAAESKPKKADPDFALYQKLKKKFESK